MNFHKNTTLLNNNRIKNNYPLNYYLAIIYKMQNQQNNRIKNHNKNNKKQLNTSFNQFLKNHNKNKKI